jgi:hypothetical protein
LKIPDLGGVAEDDIQRILMTLPKFPVYFGDVILSDLKCLVLNFKAQWVRLLEKQKSIILNSAHNFLDIIELKEDIYLNRHAREKRWGKIRKVPNN